MYISCIFHVVCASFSALATRELANAKAVFSGIWAKVSKKVFFQSPENTDGLPFIHESGGAELASQLFRM